MRVRAHLVDARDDAVDDLASERPVDDGAVLEREDGLAVLHDAPSPRAVLGLLVDDGDDVAEPARARPFDLSAQLVREVAAERLVEVGRVHDEVLREQFLRDMERGMSAAACALALAWGGGRGGRTRKNMVGESSERAWSSP